MVEKGATTGEIASTQSRGHTSGRVDAARQVGSRRARRRLPSLQGEGVGFGAEERSLLLEPTAVNGAPGGDTAGVTAVLEDDLVVDDERIALAADVECEGKVLHDLVVGAKPD